ncbi:MAG: hypothetical protein V3S37_01100, partial [Dehalococcoidia bacterium]
MEWAWLAPALSFIAFGLIVTVGRFLPGKGWFLAILAIAGAFGVFWFVLGDFLNQGVDTYDCANLTSLCTTWFEIGEATGDAAIKWGMLIDPLTIVMLGIVSFIAMLVQVYSIGYMAGHPRFAWY